MTQAATAPVTTPIPTWLFVALGEAGVQEVAGKGTNPRIAKYLQSTHLPAPLNGVDETPWCSAFVNWCLQKAGIQGTQSAAARSWEHWGMPTDRPVMGDLAVLWRESPTSGKGHVAFYLRSEGSMIWLWGGNQGNLVSCAPYPMRQVLSYRKPGIR